MAECIFAMQGAQCVSLGTQTPIYDIVLACRAQDIDIVALSFSITQSTGSVLDAISELRAKLPPKVEVWCGGASTVLRKKSTDDFRVLGTLDTIEEALQDWRQRHSA